MGTRVLISSERIRMCLRHLNRRMQMTEVQGNPAPMINKKVLQTVSLFIMNGR
jgi:hypothetical protein